MRMVPLSVTLELKVNKPDMTEGMQLMQIKTLEDENIAEFETTEQF